MKDQNVVVAGGGVLGTQIALMNAFSGNNTTILIRKEDPIEQTEAKIKRYTGLMLDDLEASRQYIGKPAKESVYPKGLISDWENLTEEGLDEIIKTLRDNFANKLKIVSDMSHLFDDVDFIVEAVTEDPEVKTAFYESIRDLLPEKTIICSNSSTLLPSTFAEHTGRPEKFSAMHFANSIWKRNTAEVMGHAKTAPETTEMVIEFAKKIHMVPLVVRKEKAGYLLNTMLLPFQWAGMELWADGYADVETIDKTWELATGAPSGPLEISDRVGLDTIYNINKMMPGADEEGHIINRLGKKLKEKIDRGETGVNAGIGFYDYRNK